MISELKTGNQEIKCYLDQVFKPMIKNWYWIVRWFLDKNKKLPEKSRDIHNFTIDSRRS